MRKAVCSSEKFGVEAETKNLYGIGFLVNPYQEKVASDAALHTSLIIPVQLVRNVPGRHRNPLREIFQHVVKLPHQAQRHCKCIAIASKRS